MMGLSSGFCCSGDSVSSPPSYSPGTSPSPYQYGGPPLMSRPTDAPFFFLGFRVGGESYTPSSAEYYEEYTPSSSPLRAASPHYTPESPSPRAVSPYHTPSSPSPRAASPYYTPLTPSEHAVADYTLSTPSRRAASPDYTPSTPPPSHLVSDAESLASPYYTPSTPDYTPSMPPPSTLVSDAESRTSPAPRRNHPYQRSGAYSRISRGRHQRAFGY